MTCCVGTRPAGTSGPTACVGAVDAGGAVGAGAADDVCEEMVADGAVGERVVRPPQAVRSNDRPMTTTLGSFMAALQCKFRSPPWTQDRRPSWNPMSS